MTNTSMISHPMLPNASFSDYESVPAFKRFLNKRLISNGLSSESVLRVVPRRSLQLAAIFVAGAAQAGMVRINMKAAGGNSVLGGVLSVANLSTFGAFSAYCSCVLLSQAFKKLTPEEKRLFESEIGNCLRAILKVSAAVAGTFSQVPMAYAAYDANDKSLFFAISRFLDAGLPILSLYLGARALFSNIGLTVTERKLEDSREGFYSIIKQKQSALFLQTPEVQRLLDSLPNLHKDTPDNYLRAILDLPVELIVEPKGIVASKKAMWVAGHASNLFVMALYGMITYYAMSLITDDDSLKISSAIFVIMCKFYLWKNSVSQAAREFPLDIYRLTGHEVRSTASQAFTPITDKVSTVAAYIIGGLSYGSMKYFCDLYGIGPAGTAVSSVATALLAKNTFSIVKDGCIEEHLARRGTPDQKRLIQFSRELEKIAQTLKNTNRGEWAKFLSSLPEDLKKALCKSDLNEEEILEYLSLKKFSKKSSQEMEDSSPLMDSGETADYGFNSNIQIEDITDQ